MTRRLFAVTVAAAILMNALPISCSDDSNPTSSEDTGADDSSTSGVYPIVGTGQTTCYDNDVPIVCPSAGEDFRGQDGCYTGNEPSYTDNGDSTVTDNVTGLMWQQDPGDKMTYGEAVSGAGTFTLAGHEDWRLPTIKELYSLILFSGTDPSGWEGDMTGLVPFIDTNYFDFEYGDESAGERLIDAQYWSSTEYVSTTMMGDATAFGVNFADGRIKGYPSEPVGPPGQEFSMTGFVLYVRGAVGYGVNDFVDNSDSTVTDQATGLMWMELDSDSAMNWSEALSFAEGLELAGHSDWRLPNVKELQSIVDYARSPSTTGSAAIDPILHCSPITNEAGDSDDPTYWSSTTHANLSPVPGGSAAYVSFGRAMGYFMSAWRDVHGAGAQRSDPKMGNPDDYPTGHGPQGDAIRIYNYVRCVRGGSGN